MYLFRTSGETLPLVVEGEKHAYPDTPTVWGAGERVLLSKNHADLEPGERQIQYVANIVDIRPLKPGEAETYWGPEYEGRWRCLIELSDITPLAQQFNLADAIGAGTAVYRGRQTYSRLKAPHEAEVERFLEKSGQLDL